MEYDYSLLTSKDEVVLGEDDYVAYIPAGIASKEELFEVLIERKVQLARYGANWDAWHDVLRFFPSWPESKRLILVHEDIPLLGFDNYGVSAYLELLISGIETRKRINVSDEPRYVNGPKYEIVAIFPSQMHSAIEMFSHRSVSVNASVGIERELAVHPILNSLDIYFADIKQWLEKMDGVTAEGIDVSKGRAQISVICFRKQIGYHIAYSGEDMKGYFLSAPIIDDKLGSLLGFDDVLQIVRYFYDNDELHPAYAWFHVEWNKYDNLRGGWYAHCMEEQWFDVTSWFDGVKDIIYEGMVAGVKQSGQWYTVADWRKIWTNKGSSSEQRLVALCVLCKANILEMYDDLLLLLGSAEVKERWLSARFLGEMYDERAVPVLLAMLTEEWQKDASKEDDLWFWSWRWYALDLLSNWQTETVLQGVYQALQTWVEIEPHFDDEYVHWRQFEAELGRALGYHGGIEMGLMLPLSRPHHRFLLVNIAHGHYMHTQSIDEHEEDNFTFVQNVAPALMDILVEKCQFTIEQAKDLLQDYKTERGDFAW